LELKRTSLEELRVNLSNELNLLTNEKDELLKWKEINEEEWNREKKSLLERIAELEENIEMLKSVSSDSTSKLQQTNEKLKNECDELVKNREKLKKQKEEMEEKLNSLNKNYNNEKKEREQLEESIAKLQNDTGLNLVSLRRKLQQYVWDDMFSWNVLLDIKTELSLQDFHFEKMNKISELPFKKQVEDIDSQIQDENNRLVQLQNERNKEKENIHDDVDDDDEVEIKPEKKKEKVDEKPETKDKKRKDKTKKKEKS